MHVTRRKEGFLLIILVLLFADLLLAQKPEAGPVRIMTYNIWNGFEWGKDTIRRNMAIEWIKCQAPDVLALQELCAYTEEKLQEDALRWGHPHVQILKTDGYPTALTSKQPITLVERTLKPFWHGLLHCETYGIDFYVVHLSPADCNIRLNEARLITERIRKKGSDAYIILGDFNALSPMDARRMEKHSALKNRLLQSEDGEYSNLRMGAFDYSVISEFLACPAVDLCLGSVDPQQAHTFPSPVLIGKYDHTPETILQNRVRIDYILTSPVLSKSVRRVKIFNQEGTHLLSDHYPVMAELDLTAK